MTQRFNINPQGAVNNVDEHGNPTGGGVGALGLNIKWQDGPLGRPPGTAPNGAFLEDVIEAARQRLEFYQTASGGKFACEENDAALKHLQWAARWLIKRRENREGRGVQGLHQA